MNRIWMGVFLLFLFAIPPLTVLSAQDESAIDSQPKQAVPAKTPQRTSQQIANQAGNFPRMRRPLSEFQLAIPKFRDATNQYRETLGLEGKLDKPLKLLRAQIDAMLESLKSSKMRHPAPDTAEFKDYSKAELKWEALNSAEHIAAVLDIVAVMQNQNQDVISLKALEILYKFHGELLRLKWMTVHVE